MANYQYDEGGNMAAYFVLTFLSLILIPLSFSVYSSSSKKVDLPGCQCKECQDRRKRIQSREKRSLLRPKLGPKAIFLIVGWSIFGLLTYKISTTNIENKMYDPFEILGIGRSASDKDIKSHYKKLSRQFHPDKVKLQVNQTIEMVEAYFVELTKAYKSLTDETIRKNWELYGHPDGRQEVSMGIAIPKWVVEGNNKFWVLLGYCGVIGGLLPVMVGRWWFGNKRRTKDGVLAQTAAVFFKTIKEESGFDNVLSCLDKALQWEAPQISALNDLDVEIEKKLGRKLKSSKAMSLLYAHLLRVPIKDAKLQREQEEILLRIPTLLSSLLTISMSHNWLIPTLTAMRIHAYFAQAILPSSTGVGHEELAQLPGVDENDIKTALAQLVNPNISSFVRHLEEKGDSRLVNVKEAAGRLGKLELVSANFRVLGEKIIVPMSIVQLLIKVRLRRTTDDGSEEAAKTELVEDEKIRDRKDNAFLEQKGEAEELDSNASLPGWAHAPHWPSNRKPGWWVLLADSKSNRTVMPPTKITDVPFSDPSKERNYRCYKIQFQAPQQVAIFTWKVFIVSDTFVGEEIVQDITLKLDDPSLLAAEAVEDDISDPEEDSLAGQMALMRGGSVKKSPVHDDSSSEEESDEESSSSSSSDSDSD